LGFAINCKGRACTAQETGVFDAEIVPLPVGTDLWLTHDECPRANTSLEKLANLPPAFKGDGIVTAGNACPLNDGASVVLVTSLAKAKELGVPHTLAFEAGAVAGVDPNYLGIGPVASTRKLLKKRPDLAPNKARLIEFNEAFAAQVVASLDELGIEDTKVNLDGGALALGHPFGASGAILVTRLFHQFRALGNQAQPGDLGLAMMGIGGGMGLTAAFSLRSVS
jgi:acetyl-CoA C-acetyltransferase